MTNYIYEVIAVFVAIGLWEMLMKGVTWWNNKDRIQLEELKCDLCKEARKLVRTPDEKHFWLCATCMGTYLNENAYSDLEKEKIMNSYKKRIKRRGKGKK